MIKTFFMKLSFVIPVLLCLISQPTIAADSCQTILKLPIETTLIKQQIYWFNLGITIPKHFKCCQKNLKNNFLEFIPNTENRDNWSETILSQMASGQEVHIFRLFETLKKKFQYSTSALTILEECIKYKGPDASFGHFSIIMSYEYNACKQVTLAKYFAGHDSYAGFQYTVALTPDMTENQAIEKLKTFVQHNTCLCTS